MATSVSFSVGGGTRDQGRTELGRLGGFKLIHSLWSSGCPDETRTVTQRIGVAGIAA
ncbi:hypothetical protein ACFOWZ_39960 [Lentzea rhizosphaerae]|uniref:Uncharacterized protein n=1 Tax=Lentzea rhizosphaerae TaxID=2041025 RepID=A0ABV8C6Q1_9PSEU